MGPAAALRAATGIAARVLGVDGLTGTIEEGKRADLLVVDGDPFADIADLRAIYAVLKGGELAHHRAAGADAGVTER